MSCESARNSGKYECATSISLPYRILATIDQEMRKIFDIPDNVETRLWNRYTANTYEQLAKLDATVQDTGLYSGQPILIEKKNPDGTWPRVAKRYLLFITLVVRNNINQPISFDCKHIILCHCHSALTQPWLLSQIILKTM